MDRSSKTAEIVQLDRSLWRQLISGDDESAFFESWLALQARQLPGVQSAVLVAQDESGKLLPRAFWPTGATPSAEAMKAAQSCARRKSGVVRRSDSEGQAAFAYPVMLGEDVVAVSAFAVSPQSEANLQEALRRVQWGSVWLENHFSAKARDALSESSEFQLAALDLIAVTLEHTSARSAALAFATEAARRLGAARVSLGRRAFGKTKIFAISHVAKPDRRQGLVRTILGAMDEAMDQGTSIVLTGAEAADAKAQITVRHRELRRAVGEGGPVITVPLHDKDKWVGAITAEFPPDTNVVDDHVGLVEAAGMAGVQILDLRRRDERWLVTKIGASLWRHISALLGPGYLGRKLVLLAVLAATAFFWWKHVEFRLPANAALEGAVQRVIAAPYDGYITDSFARAGDLVKEGALLVTLDETDLQLELAAWETRRAQYVAERQDALAQRDIARARVFEAQIDEADVQIELARSRLVQSEIRAPFDGLILSGDLSQALGSGVRLGDPMFNIAPLDSYRVRLRVDEEDINLVETGQKGQLVLASRPDMPLTFEVTRLTPVTEPLEGRNYFQVEAELDRLAPFLRPGMEGIARVDVGEARLIWTWTRRAGNWLRMQAWRWWP